MLDSKLAKRLGLIVFILALPAYFYGLARLPLLGADEARYAQVAREMFERGDWITPTLGGHPWFEKPALTYWMMIPAYRLFGVNEFSARIGSAILGMLTVLILAALARRLERSNAALAGMSFWTLLVGLSTGGILGFAHGASFDMPITFATTAALACFFVVESEPNQSKRTRFLALLFACVGLSLLAKGLVGPVVSFGVIGAYFGLRREWPRRQLIASLIWGIPITIAIASLWYAPVIARHGWEFVDEFFIQHHLARYVSDKYRHPQPIYFFISVILLFTLPWTVILVDALLRTARARMRDPNDLSRLTALNLAWLVVPVLFFSLSGSKLPGYVLPAVPGAIVLIALRLNKIVCGDRPLVWPIRLSGLLLLCTSVGFAAFSINKHLLVAEAALLMAAPIMIGGALATFVSRRRVVAVVAIGVSILLFSTIVLHRGGFGLANGESVRDLMKEADNRGFGSARVYGLHTVERTAEFYAAGRYAYDSAGEPIKFEGVEAIEAIARQSNQPILVLVPVEHERQLSANRRFETERLGDNGNVALFVLRFR